MIATSISSIYAYRWCLIGPVAKNIGTFCAIVCSYTFCVRFRFCHKPITEKIDRRRTVDAQTLHLIVSLVPSRSDVKIGANKDNDDRR